MQGHKIIIIKKQLKLEQKFNFGEMKADWLKLTPTPLTSGAYRSYLTRILVLRISGRRTFDLIIDAVKLRMRSLGWKL